MWSHSPVDYVCPFCQLLAGDETAICQAQDVVATNGLATAFIAPRWWPRNHGHVLVIPNEHHENLYELPSAAGHAVHDLVRSVAVALRHTYKCDGTSVRQHNEPAGGQDVWHYHMHVFPRYTDDNLHSFAAEEGFVSRDRRLAYAQRLRAYFATA